MISLNRVFMVYLQYKTSLPVAGVQNGGEFVQSHVTFRPFLSQRLLLALSLSGNGEDTYPDLLALFIALLVTLVVALGVRNSVGFNNLLNAVNLVVWAFMVLAGLFFLSASNWESGRFLPYGWSGVRRPNRRARSQTLAHLRHADGNCDLLSLIR